LDFFTDVDFNASSLVFTVQSDISYNPAAFNGPEFSVLSGNPFGNVVSVSSPPGEPVAHGLTVRKDSPQRDECAVMAAPPSTF
jgi:hypothetical protein